MLKSYWLNNNFYTLLLMLLVGCTSNTEESITNKELVLGEVIEIPVATQHAKYPRLYSANDSLLYISWIEDGHLPSINVASYNTQTKSWQQLPNAVQDSLLFVNWADFPELTVDKDGNVLLQYLKITDASSPYAYHVMQQIYTRQTQQWTEPTRLHADTSSTEHGFVSTVPTVQGFTSIWLDGNRYAAAQMHSDEHEHAGEMSLRYRTTTSLGQLEAAQEIDARTCDCCNTALASLPNQKLLVAYRNRSEEEIRDIYYSIFDKGNWSEPQPIANDNWQIYGCPVNGPAVTASESMLAVAWYTGADGGKVQLRTSTDEGKNWSATLIADSLNPVGRVQLALQSNKVGLLSWLNTEGKLLYRPFTTNGFINKAIIVDSVFASRKAGFPQMVNQDNSVYIAYTLTGKGIKLRKISFEQ